MAAALDTTPRLQNFRGPIALISMKLPDGKGDVASGYEISIVLKRIFPNTSVVSAYFTQLAIERLYGNERVVKLTAEDEKGWDITPIETVFQRIHRKEFALIIINSFVGDEQLPREVLSTEIPRLNIAECGAASNLAIEPKTYIMGFRPYEIGILFPDRLHTASAPKQGQTAAITTNAAADKKEAVAPVKAEVTDHKAPAQKLPNQTALDRFNHLQGLPSDLLERILDVVVTPNNFTQEVTNFNTSSRLYCAYGRHGESALMIGFVEALCTTDSQEDNAHITVCFLNDMPEGFEINRRVLFSNRFKGVNPYVMNTDTQKLELKKPTNFKGNEKGNRVLTIIFKPLRPEQADRLAMACEQETFCAGESSLFKFLALGMFPAYHVTLHKLRFIKDMIEKVLKPINGELAALLINCYFGSKELFDQADSGDWMDPNEQIQPIKKGMIQFFQTMKKRPDLQAAWASFILEISQKHCFEQGIQKNLIRDFPQLFLPKEPDKEADKKKEDPLVKPPMSAAAVPEPAPVKPQTQVSAAAIPQHAPVKPQTQVSAAAIPQHAPVKPQTQVSAAAIPQPALVKPQTQVSAAAVPQPTPVKPQTQVSAAAIPEPVPRRNRCMELLRVLASYFFSQKKK
jgi:hypothetical protein